MELDPTHEQDLLEVQDGTAELPKDALENLLKLNIRATLLALVPSYRLETASPSDCFCCYLLVASGTGTTSKKGQAESE